MHATRVLRGKMLRANHNFWLCLWLVENVARVFKSISGILCELKSSRPNIFNTVLNWKYLGIKKVCCNPLSFQGPKSEDDVGDGAEADELSGYDPESDATTMTVNYYYMHRCKLLFLKSQNISVWRKAIAMCHSCLVQNWLHWVRGRKINQL